MFPGLVTAFVATMHKLLTCERKLRNAIGIYCGNKDRDLSDTGKVVTCFP